MGYFEDHLTAEEKETLINALPWITVLIAGADGNIDDEEIEWAKKVTHIRSYKLKGIIKTYYEEQNIDFGERLANVLETTPKNTAERNQYLSEKLSGLNAILSKLDVKVGANMYKSFISFAEHVAKASGGLLGFFSVSADEAKLIGLPMIDPIHHDGEEDEEE